jgi:hypothetical protein
MAMFTKVSYQGRSAQRVRSKETGRQCFLPAELLFHSDIALVYAYLQGRVVSQGHLDILVSVTECVQMPPPICHHIPG